MKSLFVALIACLGLVLATGADQPKKDAKKKDNAGPVVNGLQLSLSADKAETIMDGKNTKPVALKLTFTNVSDKAIKFNAFDFNWSLIKGEVKASVAGSVEIQRIAADRVPVVPKAEDFPEIKPGQTWTYDKGLSFPGSIPEGGSTFALYSVVKPAEFRVKFTYTSKAINNPLAKNAWTGELVSNEVAITFKAAK